METAVNRPSEAPPERQSQEPVRSGRGFVGRGWARIAQLVEVHPDGSWDLTEFGRQNLRPQTSTGYAGENNWR
jgi:hypothetical protein